MKKFTFEAKNLTDESTKTVEALYKKSLKDRKGYNENFLGIKIPLPKLTDKDEDKDKITGVIAINNEPGPNGKNYLDYSNYSVMFNKTKKLPFFTAVNIVGETNDLAMVHEERSSDTWYNDYRTLENDDNFQFKKEDYINSGFQRGHMVRYYDPAWDIDKKNKKIAIGDTFYFTNCCPQSPKFNIGIWNDLEDYYMARAIFQDKMVTVFSGPIIKGSVEHKKLLVPLSFWKVIVYKNEDKIQAMAFLISHKFDRQEIINIGFTFENQVFKAVKPTLKKADIDRLFNKRNLKKWVVKIELIEDKTGIDFGLNDFDINKHEDKYFNIDVEDLKINEAAKDNILIKDVVFTDIFPKDDDTEFIKNL